MKSKLMDLLIPVLPKHDLSHWVGRLVHHELPAPIAAKSVELFAKAYKINLDEAELPLSSYKTIGDLFTRKLKPEARPLGDSTIVHPADAVVSEAGRIEKLTLIQAKDKIYSVSELLRSPHWSQHFEGGQFATYYLCPTDYHRVHSPVAGDVVWSAHVPGQLWPVNSWSVERIDHLFAINERVITMIDTPVGMCAVVMVAATNVGNMTMSYDETIRTNRRGQPGEVHPRERTYKPVIRMGKGDELGTFHMGSTVVMLLGPGFNTVELSAWRGRRTLVRSSSQIT